jgi:protocatechuate 3,4-dioxygenase beta subunit
MIDKSNRRSFLKLGATAAGLVLSPKAIAAGAQCILTPAQTPGPFYPGESSFNFENDLTVVPGKKTRALGQVIYIKGTVTDQHCQPVAGATVEIWQACATGRYNNKLDPNPAAIDPNFSYWGETLTNDQGEYQFKSIIPGAYPADTDWMRPPHIHFKLAKLGYKELVTQMYFKGNEYNEKDLILKAIPVAQRPSVVVDFQPSSSDMEPGSLMGTFDISISSVR